MGNNDNQLKGEFKPLKIKEYDYGYLAMVMIATLSVVFSCIINMYIIFFLAIILAIFVIGKFSINKVGCGRRLLSLIEIGIGVAMTIGLKCHDTTIVISLIIFALLLTILVPRQSFKADENGVIKIGCKRISCHDVRFLYTQGGETVFHTKNQDLTIYPFLSSNSNKQFEQFIINTFGSVFSFRPMETYYLTCALAMIVSENPETKQFAINHLKAILINPNFEISELLYAFRNKYKELKMNSAFSESFYKGSIKESSQKEFLDVLFQCATYKGAGSNKIKEKIHSFSQMMCIPEETFLVVAYKYNYGDNDTDEPGDTYAGNTYNNENQELGEDSYEGNPYNKENRAFGEEETKKLINFFFNHWENENVLGRDGTLHIGEIKLRREGSDFFHLYISQDHIILKDALCSLRHINLRDISKISPVTCEKGKKSSYCIQIGEEEFEIPYDENLMSNKYRGYVFLNEIVNGNLASIKTEMVQDVVVNLFAFIVKMTNDSNSKKYAVNYLHQKYWSNYSIISVHILFYSSCENGKHIAEEDYSYYRSCTNYEDRYMLLNHLFECAYISDGVDEKELEILQKIADSLHIKKWDLMLLLYEYECKKAEKEKDEEKKTDRQKKVEKNFKNVLTEAHRTLGLTADATVEEIKAAYRELAKKSHPDTLPADATPQQFEKANENFRVINEAYKFLMDLESKKS